MFNSDIVTASYREDSREKGRVFAQVKKSKLEVLPVFDPNDVSGKLKAEIAHLSRKIVEMLRENGGDFQQASVAKADEHLQGIIAKVFSL